jgi:hypothetical protein
MKAKKKKKWTGLCPAGKHGLDHEGQRCDECARQKAQLDSILKRPSFLADIQAEGRARRNPRLLWRPKLEAMPVQCVSCPFRIGNNKEFGAICDKLDPSIRTLNTLQRAIRIEAARYNVREQVSVFGDFSCHQSVYNPDMTTRPYREQRQCPGASEHYVNCGERK